MEQIKLPNGPTIDFYTVAEKKPDQDYHQVIFIISNNQSCYSIIRGYYRSFKTAMGRFVSDDFGSHKENTVLYWSNAYHKKN